MCRAANLYSYTELLRSALSGLDPRLRGDDKLGGLCHPIFHYGEWLQIFRAISVKITDDKSVIHGYDAPDYDE